MPTWGEILTEIGQTAHLLRAQGAPANASPFDVVRRKYLQLAVAKTGRPLILYSSAWLTHQDAPASLVSVADDDMHGLMETVHGLPGPNLDLILHSPGGSPN